MRLIGIGDVHGCAATLDALLARLALRAGDFVVFVGDYVDRGPDSRGVIERVLALEASSGEAGHPTFAFLRGNHDQMMLDYADGTGDLDLWLYNGGGSTLENYLSEGKGLPAIPEAHVAFLRRTRLVLNLPGFAFVHAGLDPALSVAENAENADPRVLLWTRDHFKADRSAWEKTVVCGHTPVTAPVNEPDLIAIDTGAVYPHRKGLGKLTAVILPERAFVQVGYGG